jgi:hypothetical protein
VPGIDEESVGPTITGMARSRLMAGLHRPLQWFGENGTSVEAGM